MTRRPRKGRRRRATRKLLGRARHLLAWAIVLLVLGAVIGGVAMLVFARETRPPPHIGDHWHAAYEIWVCGEKQPALPRFEAGVHTHGDGLIHIHPFNSSEEGSGAALGKFFEYGGYTLTSDSLVIPGVALRNGDVCQDGKPGQIRVLVNGAPVEDFVHYIPNNGDQIRIEFAP